VSGAEALVRWQRAGSKSVPANEFVPVLEDMGRVNELGMLVLDQACGFYRRLLDNQLELPKMAVNLAAPQLEDADLVQTVNSALHKAGLTANRLELEVTESMLVPKFEGVQKRLWALKDAGVKVALDDFGTGYSSLQYLTRYPFSKLKIDKSFIWQMDRSAKDSEVVKAIISLGQALGIEVLAEGVESAKQLEALKAMGCGYVQGFYYSHPLDQDKFMDYLRFPG
jgi:EAL domain-containing protein (putative c-di-GMP-specific phosphodiesterase class I)